MAATLDLSIDQGADYSIIATLTDQNDALLDLNGYAARAEMRKHYSSTTKTTFTCTPQTPLTNGEIKMSLTYLQTALLVPGRYVYDLEIVANSVVTRVLEGVVVVRPGVTRETDTPTTDIYGTSLTP